jgi:hypothetical protein
MPTPTATADDVRAINGATVEQLPDTSIDPFLLIAACVMEEIAGCTSGKSIDADCLTQAEAALAAHYLSLTPVGNSTRVKAEEKFENYSVKWAMGTLSGGGIMSSSYGIMANALTGGCLTNVDKSPALICSFG